jgi:hypothetical protein
MADRRILQVEVHRICAKFRNFGSVREAGISLHFPQINYISEAQN